MSASVDGQLRFAIAGKRLIELSYKGKRSPRRAARLRPSERQGAAARLPAALDALLPGQEAVRLANVRGLTDRAMRRDGGDVQGQPRKGEVRRVGAMMIRAEEVGESGSQESRTLRDETVRLKPDTTKNDVRLKPDTT